MKPANSNALPVQKPAKSNANGQGGTVDTIARRAKKGDRLRVKTDYGTASYYVVVRADSTPYGRRYIIRGECFPTQTMWVYEDSKNWERCGNGVGG